MAEKESRVGDWSIDHSRDPDDEDYWWGGYPRHWWNNPGFTARVAEEDREHGEAVLAQWNASRRRCGN